MCVQVHVVTQTHAKKAEEVDGDREKELMLLEEHSRMFSNYLGAHVA